MKHRSVERHVKTGKLKIILRCSSSAVGTERNDLWGHQDNHSVMKLHNQELWTEDIQRTHGFYDFIDNKAVFLHNRSAYDEMLEEICSCQKF